MNRLTSVVAFACLLFLGGCNDGSLTGNRSVTQFSSAVQSDLSVVARYGSTPPDLLMAFAQKFIGPEGGSLRLYDFEVVVPPNAVDKPTRFKITLPADPTAAKHVFAEFSPHNVRFAVPVKVIVPYAGTSAEGTENPHVLWYDGSSWVQYATTLTADGKRLETLTNHFSEYGTEENNRGITLAGKPRLR